MKELWVEKYRPDTVDGYVFKDNSQKEKINSWIKEGSIPHLLLSGSAGIGKTTLAKLLINQLGVQSTDVMVANGSKEARKVEWIDKLIMFCQTMPFGEFKVVLIDEADFMNPLSVQPALRNLMEEYSHSVRFILTCNYPNKIIPALHSRCQQMHFEKIDQTEFTARVAEILITETVEFDLDTLDSYVKAYYPDMRKCIGTVQLHSQNGTLESATATGSSADFQLEMVSLFKAGKITEARKLVCGQAQTEEMEEIYRWLYNNIELFGDAEQQDNAILIIKQGLVDHTLVADAEINLAATLIRLARL
jgi:DNA polymerase III delta prime subunit